MTGVIILLVGIAVGLLSGLVGIGGGVLIVPFLYFFYDHPDIFGVIVSPDARVVLAHGTSLFVIMPTSVRGALTFHRSQLVEWKAVWPIGIASVIAALIGARLAPHLPPETLKIGFGTLLIFSGARIGIGRRNDEEEQGEPKLGRARTISAGLLIGFLSALLGVGGGTIAIPLLIYLVGLNVRQVAATSIGIIGLTATAGSLGYMISGWGHPGLPAWSVGYVHISAGLVMFIGSVISVRWGARWNQTLKPRTLELMFSALFVLLGLRLVGGNLLALLDWILAV